MGLAMGRRMLVGSDLLSVWLSRHTGLSGSGPGSIVACWLATRFGSLGLSCSADGGSLRIEEAEPERPYSMDDVGEVTLEDGSSRPDVAVVISRHIDSVHGIYTAGTEALLGIDIRLGTNHLVVTCWGDELNVGSMLPEGLRNDTGSE